MTRNTTDRDRLSVQEVDVMFDFKVVVPEMLRAGH